MVKSGEVPRHRTRVFFFLILSVAVLWAIFLLHQGEVLQFFFLFASLAAINPVVGFIELKNNGKNRNLLIFYCLILVALLLAVFLLYLGVHLWVSLFIEVQEYLPAGQAGYLGVHLWVSLFIFIIVVGVPLLLRATGETRTIAVA